MKGDSKSVLKDIIGADGSGVTSIISKFQSKGVGNNMEMVTVKTHLYHVWINDNARG